jgi:hypothetical protein
MTKGVDPDCYDLAAKFLGDAYKGMPPTKEEAAADLRTLSEAIQEAIDDWFYAKYDGERGP